MSEQTLSEHTLYVTYFISQQQKFGTITNQIPSGTIVRPLFPVPEEHAVADNQKKAVQDFLEPRQSNSEVIETFTEFPDNKRTSKWPELTKAVNICKIRSATLIIAELGILTNNESFTQVLLESGIDFYCCDQPFVNQTILEALHKHHQVQRKVHGELIREGLKLTTAKSGNPNAAEVISKVNKPKIDTAIVFAFLLKPIIDDYRRKGFSQRQMVKTLNEEGFTAPEGGKWVLSQLQKVLDRVKLNEVATEHDALIEELRTKEMSLQQMVEELNSRRIQPLKRTAWDENQVKKLIDRIDQIKDIVCINRFVLALLPLLHAYRHRNFSAIEIVKQFDQAGLPIRQQNAEVAA